MASLVEIKHSDLGFHEKPFARGNSGVFVFRANWKPQLGRVVAVKKFPLIENEDSQKLRKIEEEAENLNQLRHRNIILFLGIIKEPTYYGIVTECAAFGSLHDYIAHPNNPLDFSTVLKWSTDIAKALDYMHNHAPVSILHRDVKSKNFVIDDINGEKVVKLIDFGSSRLFDQTTSMSMNGTFRWMAPEAIQGDPVSHSADTYSFGVMLGQMLTRELPFKDLKDEEVYPAVVYENLRLTIPEGCPPGFANLMRQCWDAEPKNRPSFADILKVLETMRSEGINFDCPLSSSVCENTDTDTVESTQATDSSCKPQEYNSQACIRSNNQSQDEDIKVDANVNNTARLVTEDLEEALAPLNSFSGDQMIRVVKSLGLNEDSQAQLRRNPQSPAVISVLKAWENQAKPMEQDINKQRKLIYALIKTLREDRKDVVDVIRENMGPGFVGVNFPNLKISDMGTTLRLELTQSLSIQRASGADWRGLAEHLKMKSPMIQFWEQKSKNPSEDMLMNWQTSPEATIGNLYNILIDLDMHNLAGLLEEES